MNSSAIRYPRLTLLLTLALVAALAGRGEAFAQAPAPADPAEGAGSGEDAGGGGEEEGEGEAAPAQEKGPAATDATAAKLINLCLQASGGPERIRGLRTLRSAGDLKEGKKIFAVRYYRKRPSKYREGRHYRLRGRDYINVTGTDGMSAWTQEIKPKVKPPEVFPKKKAEQFLAENGDLLEALVEREARGFHFAYQGNEDTVRGRPVYTVMGAVHGGRIVWLHFDQKSYLLVRVGFKDRFAGRLIDAEMDFIKFRKVGGIVLPEKIEYHIRGQVYRTITLKEIDVNLDVPDDMFATPVFRSRTLGPKPGS